MNCCEKRGKVFYLCFYAEKDNMNDYVTFPSAWNKVEYITKKLLDCGYEVELLSAARSKSFAKSKDYIVSDVENHHYFSSIGGGGRFLGRLMKVWINLQIILYILVNAKSDDQILVYHSLYYCFAVDFCQRVLRKKVILEIEEIYSYTDIEVFNRRKKEIAYLCNKRYYICVNELIKNQIAKDHSAAIAYGDYRLPPNYQIQKKTDNIHSVYAGVIEQTRKAAFIAIEALRFLPESYVLHIMGFGNPENICALEKKIDAFNQTEKYKRVFYDGHFSGEGYFKKLQQNHIALSTHMYAASDAGTARYMFSSKILSYLSNGLPVVAQRLECLENSQVSGWLCFYEKPDPKMIADAIMSVDLKDGRDPRTVIQELDQRFTSEFDRILRE